MSRLFAKALMEDVVKMIHDSNTSHLGGCLSCIDIIDVLFSEIIKINNKEPKSINRDRFILSKGHVAAIIYSALSLKGFFPRKWLDSFFADGTKLPGHIDHKVPGVEYSSGSLGHGLSVGVGMAISLKNNKIKSKVYTLCSDGEMNSGSTLEAIMFAGHHNINNLICIVDKNQYQALGRTEDVINLDPLSKKWESFGWDVYDIDGHNRKEIKQAFVSAKKSSVKPSVLICNTIKGKGMKDFEGKLMSHYRPPNDDQLREFLENLKLRK